MYSCYDVIVIGGGILGCFAARAFRRYKLDVAVLESREDVCTGITRANTGIIYPGYDQHPGSLKARLCVKGSAGFQKLCSDLDVHFRKRGLMMLSFGPVADKVLEKKLKQSRINGVSNVSIIGPSDIYKLEPGLCGGIRHALYSKDNCVVDPWELGIAAFENARANGAEFHFNSEVTDIKKENGIFRIFTDGEEFRARRILVCAGFHSDRIWEMVNRPRVRIVPQEADYVIFDPSLGDVISHVISVEPEEKGGGLTLVPTAEGNIMAGPTRRDGLGEPDYNTDEKGIDELLNKLRALIPEMNTESVIRCFGAARPNPYYVNEDGSLSDRSISDFEILEEDGSFALIGVKTPGITCAAELGDYITERIIGSLPERPGMNPNFDPVRKGIVRTRDLDVAQLSKLVSEDPDFGEIVCRCKHVSRGEIIEAIRRGAVTVSGVKRRCGAGMGRCQGGYCQEKILHIISEELGTDIRSVTLDGAGSGVLSGTQEIEVRS